ncbi:hypothetical protein PENTCL1PPCAC_21546, partial [Pristionchus entomophagus]
SLKAGDKYRVYAVYASSAPNDAYARSVVIRGADNTQFNVADLAKAKPNTGYVLDENKILTAPISVSCLCLCSQPQKSIILNTIFFKVAPVISAQLANGAIDCDVAKLTFSSCTVLSAEKNFLISN